MLARLDVAGRVARQTLDFAHEYGEPIAVGIRIPSRLMQADLASFVGASRVRVNQVLVNYKHQGYLSVDDHHRLTVHDPVALARECR